MKVYTFNKKLLQYEEFHRDRIRNAMLGFGSFTFFLGIMFGMLICAITGDNLRKTIKEKDDIIAELNDIIHNHSMEKREACLYEIIGREITDPNRFKYKANKEDVINYIDYLDSMGLVMFPDIIKANAILESGAGTSNLAKTQNNIFGMKRPNVRHSTCINNEGTYGEYMNYKLAICDRILWDYANFRDGTTTETHYLMILDKLYGEAENYSGKIVNVKKKL